MRTYLKLRSQQFYANGLQPKFHPSQLIANALRDHRPLRVIIPQYDWGGCPFLGIQLGSMPSSPPVDPTEELLPQSLMTAFFRLCSGCYARLQHNRRSVCCWMYDPCMPQLPSHRQHGAHLFCCPIHPTAQFLPGLPASHSSSTLTPFLLKLWHMAGSFSPHLTLPHLYLIFQWSGGWLLQ